MFPMRLEMRRALPLALGLAMAVPAPATASDSGGAPTPLSGGGGSSYGEVVPQGEAAPAAPRRTHRRRRTRSRGPLLTLFRLIRPKLFLYGRSARVDYRIQGRARRVHVRLLVRRPGVHEPVSTIELGDQSTNATHSARLTGRESGVLPQGSYVLRIGARDARGRRLRRAASASAVSDLSFFHHRFPVAGPFTYGGPDARFGAPRRGHTHQGQDMAAAEGTPVVAPRGGVVKAVQYQGAGAGHYVVLDGEGEDRDYVFMHLRSGSIVVREGQRVRTGQRLGEVGSTGESSGPHLHFEIWLGGGWYTGGHPVDPLPFLQVWDRWS
jgi:murein DD-endopeptidase MepM/ murein hydrolase activator NlpD